MSKPIKFQLIILQKHMEHEICIVVLTNFFSLSCLEKNLSDLHINERLCRLACWKVSQWLNPLKPEACVQTGLHCILLYSNHCTSCTLYIISPGWTWLIWWMLVLNSFLIFRHVIFLYFLTWEVWPTWITKWPQTILKHTTKCCVYEYIYFMHGFLLTPQHKLTVPSSCCMQDNFRTSAKIQN